MISVTTSSTVSSSLIHNVILTQPKIEIIEISSDEEVDEEDQTVFNGD